MVDRVVDDNVVPDVFEVGMAIKVTNQSLNLHCTIHPAFIKVEDDRRFVLLDFYQSRGIYQILVSRLPPQPHRHYFRLLAKVVAELKKARDLAFRKSVLGQSGKVIKHMTSGPNSIKPRSNDLLTIATELTGVFSFTVPPSVDEFDGFCLDCYLSSLDRRNGNSELWVDDQASTWNYLTKLVKHTHSIQSLETENNEVAPVDPPVATPIAESPIAATIAESPIAATPCKRLSFGDGPGVVRPESQPKRQTTLRSFMKAST